VASDDTIRAVNTTVGAPVLLTRLTSGELRHMPFDAAAEKTFPDLEDADSGEVPRP
jgi:hypothetical protein